MAGIFEEVQMREDAYASNPQGLQQRYAQSQQLVDLLALQQVSNAQQAAKNQITAAMETNPSTRKEQLEQEVLSGARSEVMAELAPGLQQRGRQTQQIAARQATGMPMSGGLPTQPANNMMRAAQGGIVGYAKGGMPEQDDSLLDPNSEEAQRKRYMQLKAAEAQAISTNNIEMLRNVQLELANYEGSTAAQPPKPTPENTFDMAGGGIVSLAAGGTFPDLNKDGEVTQADILMGRGVAGKQEGGVVGYRDGGEIDMDALLDALMIAESGGDPNAVSRAGAEGAYQIMPSTAADPGFGVSPMEGDRFDPEASRSFARQYLQAMIDRYDGDLEAGLIAYNAGAGNADKFIAANRDYDVLPQTMQTQPYVRKIMGRLEKEGRRRDLQMGGGRTISTTAPESYTERARRERLAAQETMANRQQALGTFLQGEEAEEVEMYKPNLPDALTVMKGQSELTNDDITVPEPTNAQRFAGLFPGAQASVDQYAADKEQGGIGYLRRIGEQQENRREDFNQAFPGAQASIDQYAEDKEQGGIGYLRRIGEQQDAKKAQERRAVNFMAMLQDNQNMINEVDPAAPEEQAKLDIVNFLATLQDNQNKSEFEPVRPFVNESFKNGGGVKHYQGTSEDGSLVQEDPNFLIRNANRLGLNPMENQRIMDKNRALREENIRLGRPVFYGSEPLDLGMSPSEFIEPFKDDPVSTAAGYLLSAWGVGKLLKLGGPALKTLQQKVGAPVVQKAKELALRATTKPNPALTKGGVGPTIKPGFTMRSPGTPGRVVDPKKLGVGALAAITAEDAIFGRGDAPTEEVEETTVEEIIKTPTQTPPPPSAKTGLSGANIDFNLLRQMGAAGAAGTSTGDSLARMGEATGKELGRREQVTEKRRADEARNAVLQQQVLATLGAQNARTTQYITGLLGEFKSVENRRDRDAMIAAKINIPIDELKDYREKNPQDVINKGLEVDRDYLLLLNQQFGTSGRPAGAGVDDPEIAALVSQYTT